MTDDEKQAIARVSRQLALEVPGVEVLGRDWAADLRTVLAIVARVDDLRQMALDVDAQRDEWEARAKKAEEAAAASLPPRFPPWFCEKRLFGTPAGARSSTGDIGPQPSSSTGARMT